MKDPAHETRRIAQTYDPTKKSIIAETEETKNAVLDDYSNDIIPYK